MAKPYAHTIVAPAIDYRKRTIEVKKGAQVERMKTVRTGNPLYVLGKNISVPDIEGLKILTLSQHPQITLQIEVMKDTFDMSDWWKANCAKLPAFTYVVRAVLTKSQFNKRPLQ